MRWRAEPLSVEMLSDELCVGAKDQSNSVIAGSLRNILRDSLAPLTYGGRALIDRGSLPGYQRLSNFEYRVVVLQESDCGG